MVCRTLGSWEVPVPHTLWVVSGPLGVLAGGRRWEAGQSLKVRTWQHLPGRTMEYGLAN